MTTVNVRLPEEKRDMLKIIASVEKRDMKDILSELVDDYIDRHKETLLILTQPEWVELISEGKKEIKEDIKGKSLDELED